MEARALCNSSIGGKRARCITLLAGKIMLPAIHPATSHLPATLPLIGLLNPDFNDAFRLQRSQLTLHADTRFNTVQNSLQM